MASTAVIAALNRISDRFGAPTGVAVAIFGLVGWFGSTETKDRFVRAVLFGEQPSLTVLFVILAVDFLFGFKLRRRFLDGESVEMKRIADEKSRLQALLLDRSPSKTRDFGASVETSD